MKCRNCEGNTSVECSKCNGSGFDYGRHKCDLCSGEGSILCPECEGKGKVSFFRRVKKSS